MEAYEKLEQEIAEWSGMPFVVACSSGTAALHLALETVGVSGYEVLVPEFTMVACARAVSLANGVPRFVDCDDRLLMRPDLIQNYFETCASSSTCRAVMPVHVYGRRCDMDSLVRIAREYFLFIIEDMAEAHGVKPHIDTDAACWSFYKNKIVAGEEGGAVGFHRKELADRARKLRCLGFTEQHDFLHLPRGCNYRLANTLAKLISRSLTHFEDTVQRRRWVERQYDQVVPTELKMPPRAAPWVYDVKTTNPNAVPELNELGLPARHAFKPMSRQNEYFDIRYAQTNAYRWSKELIYLPLNQYRCDFKEVVEVLTRE